MPTVTEYTSSPNGVIIYTNGDLTGEEIIEAIKAIYYDERFLSLDYWIGDHSECARFLPSIEDLMQIGTMNRIESKRNPGILLALVAPKPETYGVCRQFEPLNDKSEFVTRVFKNREQADSWIAEKLSNR